jgi:hypothetical protein
MKRGRPLGWAAFFSVRLVQRLFIVVKASERIFNLAFERHQRAMDRNKALAVKHAKAICCRILNGMTKSDEQARIFGHGEISMVLSKINSENADNYKTRRECKLIFFAFVLVILKTASVVSGKLIQ